MDIRNEFYQKAKAIEQDIIKDRRCLHQMPEVGVYTPKTAAYVTERLNEMGIPNRKCGIHTDRDRDVITFAGFEDAPDSTGVVGIIGKGEPCILLRADMDALPMKEESGLDFSNEGNTAHTCGHDAHAAMLLGAAKILKEMEDELPGTIKLAFQPGEEMGYGARTMVDDGLLENPKVDAAVAIHVHPQLPIGHMNYNPKVASSAVATTYISIQAKGGHSSEPQKTVDPINIAMQIASAINMLIPREVDPGAFATLNVGVIKSGTSPTIVPDTAELQVTFRTSSPEAYEHLLTRIDEICNYYTKAWHASYATRVLRTPGTVLDEEFTREVLPFVADIIGEENIHEIPPLKTGEDFGCISSKVPGFFGFMGAGSYEGYPLHNPKMVLDEDAFAVGTAILVNCAVEWLKKKTE